MLSLYFACAAASTLLVDLAQSISEFAVKFCKGTNFQTSRLLSCVTFRTPSITRANLLLMYFKQFLASSSFLKFPILIKDWVYPTRGSPTRGVDKTSPIAPEPL